MTFFRKIMLFYAPTVGDDLSVLPGTGATPPSGMQGAYGLDHGAARGNWIRASSYPTWSAHAQSKNEVRQIGLVDSEDGPR
jgi:hypothetical protein